MQCGLRGEVARVPRPLTTDFEYVYAKDVGRAVDIVATIPLPKETHFNIGSGEVLTFDELTRAIREVLPRLEVEILPGAPPGTPVKQPIDGSRARNLLGWGSGTPCRKPSGTYGGFGGSVIRNPSHPPWLIRASVDEAATKKGATTWPGTDTRCSTATCTSTTLRICMRST